MKRMGSDDASAPSFLPNSIYLSNMLLSHHLWYEAEKLGFLKRLPWWFSGKESTCDIGDSGLIPASGRSPGEGNGNTLQYSCLENPMDRGSWQAAVHEVSKELDTT